MLIGKVCGTVYSTINHPFYDGKKLMLIDKLSLPDMTPSGYIIAIDSVGAGVGETVLVVDEGNSARQVVDDQKAPLRSVIVGIIDQVVARSNWAAI